MKHTTSTDLRANLSAMMDRVNDDHEPMLVTRANGRPVVMISLEDYQAMDETSYLLASPANAAQLRAALDDVAAGRVVAPNVGALDGMADE
ncbi:type II toxin-antitoxin system prevent-host-death family antitoxin [Thioclava sp. BHET1]|nr:type II toxin-antitoxin system prevent-host-death family antitoxin [Thioclava sp. BHET1]